MRAIYARPFHQLPDGEWFEFFLGRAGVWVKMNRSYAYPEGTPPTEQAARAGRVYPMTRVICRDTWAVPA